MESHHSFVKRYNIYIYLQNGWNVPLSCYFLGFLGACKSTISHGSIRKKGLPSSPVVRTVPPEDMTPTDLADLASAEVATNPAKALGLPSQKISSHKMEPY